MSEQHFFSSAKIPWYDKLLFWVGNFDKPEEVDANVGWADGAAAETEASIPDKGEPLVNQDLIRDMGLLELMRNDTVIELPAEHAEDYYDDFESHEEDVLEDLRVELVEPPPISPSISTVRAPTVEEIEMKQAKILRIALDLEKMVHGIYAKNGTWLPALRRPSDLRGRLYRITEKEKITPLGKEGATLLEMMKNITSILHSELQRTEKPDNVQIKAGVYDLVLTEERANRLEELEEKAIQEELEIIQEKKRERRAYENATKQTLRMGDYEYLLPIDWILDGGCIPCKSKLEGGILGANKSDKHWSTLFSYIISLFIVNCSEWDSNRCGFFAFGAALARRSKLWS